MIRKMRLGDNFPMKFLHVIKLALEVGLIEQKIAIYYLAIKTHAGNKRLIDELKSVINTHEEIGSIDSGLPKNARKKSAKIGYQKGGWTKQIDEKLRTREIKIRDSTEKEIVETSDKFLMEHAIEHLRDKKKG